LEKVWSKYGTEKTLFEYLIALRANGLIDSIIVEIYKDNINISYDMLSEGEKQLLIIYGLKELLASENSLILLDEPDTYLHPEWKRDFINEFFTEDETYKNFYIITSHSPNIVSAVKKGQLKILKEENNKSFLRQFTLNPYGKPVDSILIDFFGVDGLRYKKVQTDLDKLWELVKQNKYKSNKFLTLFSKLENELGKDDQDLTNIRIEIVKRKNHYEKN
jgi:ABC-type multidrug transport system ATPase subunit